VLRLSAIEKTSPVIYYTDSKRKITKILSRLSRYDNRYTDLGDDTHTVRAVGLMAKPTMWFGSLLFREELIKGNLENSIFWGGVTGLGAIAELFVMMSDLAPNDTAISSIAYQSFRHLDSPNRKYHIGVNLESDRSSEVMRMDILIQTGEKARLTVALWQ
jgi:hypothetical protein